MRAESEIRSRAVVHGPGRPGFLVLRLPELRHFADDRFAEVEVRRVPPALRMPNTSVVAVFGPEGVLRVESEEAGKARLEFEDAVRRILNEWDPIGVADAIDVEYDRYIPQFIALLRGGASPEEIEHRLVHIETSWMGLQASRRSDRRKIAARLLGLGVPPGPPG